MHWTEAVAGGGGGAQVHAHPPFQKTRIISFVE